MHQRTSSKRDQAKSKRKRRNGDTGRRIFEQAQDWDDKAQDKKTLDLRLATTQKTQEKTTVSHSVWFSVFSESEVSIPDNATAYHGPIQSFTTITALIYNTPHA
jgi:hypothetical protein